MKKLSPPGYWKDRDTSEKRIHILIRNDRYYLEPISEDEGYIVLEDFDLRIRYVGRIRWEGKQGRLEIIYVNGRWFAHIPIEVGVEPPKSNPKGYVKPIYDDDERKKKELEEISLLELFTRLTCEKKIYIYSKDHAF